MKRLIFFILLCINTSSFAQSENNVQVSISGAYMFESDNLYFAEVDRYFSIGDAVILKAEGDYYLQKFNNNFGIGLFASFGSPWYDGFEETSMIEFGPTLKWKFNLEQVELIPSLYIGYRSYEGDAGDGLGINLSFKAQFPRDKFIPFVDIGFLTQPAGGNDATDITFSPLFILGGGVGFNL